MTAIRIHAQREGARTDRGTDRVREHLRGVRRPARDDKELLDDLKVLHCLETAFLDAFPNPSEKQLAVWRQMPKRCIRSSGITGRVATHSS